MSKQFGTGLLLLLATLVTNTACEPAVRLTVTNQMGTDLTIINDALDRHGLVMRSRNLGSAPADQDTFLPQSMPLIQDAIGWTVVLKGEDGSGAVLWQRSWPFGDFVKLKDAGWKITVSPETNQLTGG
jgi:hypothetical protein